VNLYRVKIHGEYTFNVSIFGYVESLRGFSVALQTLSLARRGLFVFSPAGGRDKGFCDFPKRL